MEDELRSRGFSEIMIKLLRLAEEVNFRLNAKIICVTESIKKEIVRRYKVNENKLVVIPSGDVSAMFAGAIARMLSEHGDVLSPDECKLIHDRTDQAVRGIISQMQWRNNIPLWLYIGQPNIFNNKTPNDLLRHVYILWGI